MDTNLHYCRRLAEELLKPPPLDVVPLFDLAHEIRRLFPTLPAVVGEKELIRHLRDNPRAQAELAVLSEYTPSKWLLERELEARGLWAEPKRGTEVQAEVPGAGDRGTVRPTGANGEGLADAITGDVANARAGTTAPVKGARVYADDAYRVAAEAHATGLCFSGGGIRSATFNLGVLQALAATRRLEQFVYLSSVSGGGYIHQFLATWIYNRGLSHDAVHSNIAAAAEVKKAPVRTSLEEVEELLRPLPTSKEPGRQRAGTAQAGRHSTLAAQPLRWLARYSNYLAPRKGLVGLDTWVIFAVWLRNTLLNLVVLLSCFIALMLLPHIPITYWIVRHSASMKAQGAFDIVVGVLMFACFFVPGVILSRWVRYSDCPSVKNPAFGKIFSLVFVLFLGACLAAPAVYRSSLPNELSYFGPSAAQVNPVFKDLQMKTTQLHYSAHFKQETDEHEPDTLTVEAASHTPTPVSRLRTHWGKRPVSFLPDPLTLGSFRPSHLASWIPTNSFPAIRIAFVLGTAAGLLLLGFAARDETEQRSGTATPCSDSEEEDARTRAARSPFAGKAKAKPESGVKWWAYPILAVIGIAFGWLLLFGVRTLFFVAAFSVRPELISSLGVVLMPPLLFGLPFITLELGVGLVGDAMTDEKREWIARLRAASFLTGGAWLIVTGFSLLGPEVFDQIANTAASRWTVWAGWLGTTIAGVLAGRSAHTAGPADTEEGASTSSTALQVLTAVAPTVFIAGMLLLIAKLTNWSIASVPTPYVEPAHLTTVVLALGVFAIIFLAFGWRININDFSMHSFYRDRLARCYAGASNPHRDPNTFTGFAPTDRKLPVAALLGKDWRHGPGMRPADKHVYTGPFPIICTAVNLTTGEDLAYQERKAASFVFTPLYSGFDVGRTAGTDRNVQFNGYVPTADYVYTEHGGISLATAVAISGAAASPNMGYHSSPAMAFLMTVFNVRLGWWLRNPRRRPKQAEGKDGHEPQAFMPASTPPSVPASVPKFGPLRLLDELAGQANDSSAYIYLTDGGHFDNMGLYELVRRRCRRIVVCDAEADGALHFEGIAMAIRKARLDFGVEITLNGFDEELEEEQAHQRRIREAFTGQKESDPKATTTPAPLTVHFETQTSDAGDHGITGEIARAPVSAAQAHGLESFKLYPGNTTHAVIGTIRYPELPEELGHILYIKASLTGDEPADVLNFRKEHKTFPHDTTLNQFFTESQFESYRRLGQHIVEEDETVGAWMKYFLPLA